VYYIHRINKKGEGQEISRGAGPSPSGKTSGCEEQGDQDDQKAD